MFVDVSARSRASASTSCSRPSSSPPTPRSTCGPTRSRTRRASSIEAHLDRGRGPVATVLVQRGTLRVGDSIVAGDAYGRVRAMLDENGDAARGGAARPVRCRCSASPAVPGAGDNFLVVAEDRMARQIADQRQARERNAELAPEPRPADPRGRCSSASRRARSTQLNLILKGDVSGSVEALEDALLKHRRRRRGRPADHRPRCRCHHRERHQPRVASDAVIIGFNVRPEGKARELAEREGVDVRYYSVIYAGDRGGRERAQGHAQAGVRGGAARHRRDPRGLPLAQVRQHRRLRSSRSGTIVRNSKARLVRDGVVVADNLTIESLRRFKDDATEVREGFECGIGLGNYNDIKVDDVIETFEMREKPRAC